MIVRLMTISEKVNEISFQVDEKTDLQYLADPSSSVYRMWYCCGVNAVEQTLGFAYTCSLLALGSVLKLEN